MSVVLNSVMSLFRSNNDVLATIGAVAVVFVAVKAVFSLWRGVKVYLLARTLGLGIDLKTLGSWAVVTGSTDGIGRAYAEQLAGQGLNIVLISRSAEKLANVAQAIESQSKVKTKCIAVDFTGGLEIYETIAEGLRGLDIGVLVNNVGMSFECPLYLTELPDKRLRDVITVNCNSVTFVTKAILPSMIEKRKGVIVNISSQAGCFPVPLLTVYSATKAFVEFFSAALAEECKSKGIIVQCIAPGFVATKMSGIRKSSFIAPFPDSYVKSAIATIGVTSHAYGCISHALQGFVSTLVPLWVHSKITMSLMTSARAKALKRQQKKQ